MFNTKNELKKKELEREKKYSSIINLVSLREEPRPDSSSKILLKGTRVVPVSPLVINGASDSSALNLDAKAWLTEVQNPEQSEDAFWSKKAPNKQKKMWEDDFPDDLFAADDEVKDPRQELKHKTTRFNLR